MVWILSPFIIFWYCSDVVFLFCVCCCFFINNICRRSSKIPKGGNQNTYIEEEQTTQWPKEKVQKDKQRTTKNTHKIKYGATPTLLKTGDELRFSGRGSSSCSTIGTRRVNLVTNPVISQE
jgi:hypothetical protein